MTAAEYAASRPDLVNNWAAAHDPSSNDYTTDTGLWVRHFSSLQEYLASDYGGEFDPDNGQTYTTPPPQLVNPGYALTPLAQAYADNRPDLANNWQSAWSDQNLNDATSIWIRNFGSFQRYVENDHGGAFVAQQVVTPPHLVNPGYALSPLAQAYANTRPDLAGNWSAAWIDQNATDPTSIWIRSFGTFQKYVENDHGGIFTANQTTVVNPPPQSPFFDPTHRVIANTPAGTLYMLIDEGGSIITWLAGHETTPSNLGRATMPAAATAAALSSQYAQQQQHGGGDPLNNNTTTVHTTRIYHPITGWPIDVPDVPPDAWTRVGTTASGNPVFQLVDAGGTVKEWEVNGQGLVVFHADAAVFGIYTPAVDHTTNTTTNTTTSSGAKSGSALLLVALAIGGGLWLARRK